MLGFKIITSKEYRRLKDQEKAIEKLLEDIKAFQKEIDAKNESLELNTLHVLKTNSYPCEKCNIENQYCRKLHFADRTICVTPKDQIVSFPIGKRSNKK